MKKVFLLVSILLVIIAIPATVLLVQRNTELRKRAAPATVLSLTPSRVTKNVGDVFNVEVTIDTGENQVIATEIHLTFDQTKLEAQTITNGTLFPNILASGVVDKGVASITVGAASAAQPVKGTGTVAIVKFKALEKTDTPVSVRFASNTFVGSPGEGTTNALSGQNGASITISDGSATSPTATPTPTGTGASGTLTPTPTTQLSGTLTLTPTPTQIATNSGSATNSALLITYPAKDAQITSTRPTIQGKAPAGSTITVTVYSAPQTGTTTADTSGNWSFTPATALAAGSHQVVVTATNTTTGASQTTSSTFIVQGSSSTSTASAVPVTGIMDNTYILIALASLLLLTGMAVPFVLR